MPEGLNRTDLNTTGIDYRNGTPILLPHSFGNTITLPHQFGTSVTWNPDPAHFGNQVTWPTPDPKHFGNNIS